MVIPEKPTSITDLVKGQKYTIDKAMPGTIVYTHDDLGNVNAKYELSAWTDPGNYRQCYMGKRRRRGEDLEAYL